MSDQMVVKVATAVEDRPVSGADTTILVMPKEFYVEVEGAPVLAIQPFARFVRQLAETQAGSLGELLHHAQFVITRDPAVIESWGSIHDCEHCRAGVRGALRRLRESPADELIVGQLFWAGQPEGAT